MFDYDNYVWTCEECETINTSDFTGGVEVECEGCGTQYPDEEIYAIAEKWYENLDK